MIAFGKMYLYVPMSLVKVYFNYLDAFSFIGSLFYFHVIYVCWWNVS